MWSRKMWSRVLSWLRKVHMNRQLKRTWHTVHYAKPSLEGLTERIVPSNIDCTFTGAGGNDLWSNAANWTTMPDDSGTDTATIAAGATCVLDQSTEVKIAGLTVNGSLDTKSQISVHAGGTLSGGNGATTVASGGTLTVDTPDQSGLTSLLDTDTLSTATASGTAPNLVDNPSGEIDIADSGSVLSGISTITGMVKALNISSSDGAAVTLGGSGTVSGAGQFDAEINASFTFAASSGWTIGAGNPAGSAL